jgi:hypothetical protein
VRSKPGKRTKPSRELLSIWCFLSLNLSEKQDIWRSEPHESSCRGVEFIKLLLGLSSTSASSRSVSPSSTGLFKSFSISSSLFSTELYYTSDAALGDSAVDRSWEHC